VGGNADTDLLSDGLTESLDCQPCHLPQLKVKSRNSVFRYKGKDVDVQKVGKELTWIRLLTGRMVQHGDKIQVSAELTRVQDNTEIWGEQYERKASSATSSPLQQQIAGDIAEKLRSKLTGAEKQQVTKQGTQNPEAYQLYVKGRYYWNKRTNADIKTAISYFNQAIDKDPGYALAYAGNGGCLWRACRATMAVIPMTSPQVGLLRPKRPWSSTLRWRARMRTWACNKMNTVGIFPAARPTSARPLSSIPATLPPISGFPRDLG
jgi:TolB-like protein